MAQLHDPILGGCFTWRAALSLPAAFTTKSIGDMQRRRQRLYEAKGSLFEEGGRGSWANADRSGANYATGRHEAGISVMRRTFSSRYAPCK